MNSKGSQPQDEHRRREAELKEREQALRLREIEVELSHTKEAQIDQTAETIRMQPRETPFGRWKRRLSAGIKVLAIGVVVVVGIKLGTWIATAIVIGGAGWLAYKAFFESSQP